MEFAGSGGEMVHEKNQKQKISWHCPFNPIINSLYVWRVRGRPPSIGSGAKLETGDQYLNAVLGKYFLSIHNLCYSCTKIH